MRLLACTLILFACDDGGGSSGTRGAACRSAAVARCQKTLDCNLGFTDIELCTQLIVNRCCEDDETCDDGLSGSAQAGFRQCEADLSAQPCAQAATPPAACVVLSGS